MASCPGLPPRWFLLEDILMRDLVCQEAIADEVKRTSKSAVKTRGPMEESSWHC